MTLASGLSRRRGALAGLALLAGCDGWLGVWPGDLDDWYAAHPEPGDSAPGDQDGDGWSEADGDSDDGDAAVNPGAEEICDDGVDNDCDGTANDCGLLGELAVTEATATLIGAADEDMAGYAVAIVGDTDGDGYGDILVGAPHASNEAGDAYLLRGPLTGEIALSTADAVLSGTAGGHAGNDLVGLGDMNLDGLADVAIGAEWDDTVDSNAGAVYLMPGPIASGELSAAPTVLLGQIEHDCFGHALANAGDTDLDGVSDLVVGAYNYDMGGNASGAAFLFSVASHSGQVSAGDATAILYGTAEDDWAGEAVAGATDVNGDGHVDVAISAVPAPPEVAKTFFLLGFTTGTILDTDADAIISGPESSSGDPSWFGTDLSLAGDINADGYTDLLIGAHGSDTGGTDAGAAYLFEGHGL